MTATPRLIVRRLETARTRTDRALWHESEKVRRKALKGACRARRQALKLTAEYLGVGEPVPWIRPIAKNAVGFYDERAERFFVRAWL